MEPGAVTLRAGSPYAVVRTRGIVMRSEHDSSSTQGSQRGTGREQPRGRDSAPQSARNGDEELFRAIVEQGAGPVFVHDVQGVLRFVNPAAANLLGYPREAMVGRPLQEFMAPAARPLLHAYLARARTEPRTMGLVRVVTRGGRGRTWLYRNTTYRDSSGEQYVLGHAQDVTTLVAAARVPPGRDTDFESLVEDAPEGLYRTGIDGRFSTVNRALVSMLGYESHDQLLATDPRCDVFERAADHDGLVAAVEAGRTARLEVTWKRSDDQRIAVRLCGRGVRDADGTLVGLVVVAEDVTERRTQEAGRRDAHQIELLERWAGGVAHDFNNILTIILASAEILGAALPPDRRDLHADLDELRSAGERGTAIVARLLSFARRRPLSTRPVDLAEMVDELATRFRQALPKTVNLEVARRGAVPPVAADPGVLQQILLNLTTNAIDAMSGGGTLRVETRLATLDDHHRRTHGWGDPGEYVVIAVSDTGCGMDPDTRARIFEPFFTTKPQGAGLGMAMVYGLVKQHRGFVEVESALGAGTTVTLYFPLAVAQVADSEPAEPTAPPASSHSTVLLVEDEAPIRRAAKRLFESQGYAVVLAEDGDVALEIMRARASDIDVVVSDVMMPNMNGVELYEVLRQEGHDTRFVLTSGYLDSEIRAQAPRHEAVPFVPKPWSPAELLTCVEQTLERGA